MKTSFKVNYYTSKTGELLLSHSRHETWESLDLFCPHCGVKAVWHDTADGDYYVDEQYLCASCDHSWYMPGGVSAVGNCEQGQQRLAFLKLPEDEQDHSAPAPERRMTEEELVEMAKTDPLAASMIREDYSFRDKLYEHIKSRKGLISNLIERGTIPEGLGERFVTTDGQSKTTGGEGIPWWSDGK